MTLPDDGWVVDIEASSSLAAINANIRSELGDLGVEHLTLGDLRGEQRPVTTAIVGWILFQVLDDGSLPHGIVYGSKHGTDYKCWAIWLRQVDDAKDATSEPTKASDGIEIRHPRHNRPLAKVAQHFGLMVY